MVKYKSIFPDGKAVDAALTVAANIEEHREGSGTKFLKDDFTWAEPAAPSLIFGTTSGTACEGNDARLSDDRTPLAHTDSSHTGTAKRNYAGGVAGVDAGKALIYEHLPACMKEYHLTGKYLDGTDNPDVWFPISAGTGSVVYASRFLTLTSSSADTSANRAVIDQTKFPIAGKFIEVTARLGAMVDGAGGARRCVVGFQSGFNEYKGTARATFYSYNGIWRVGYPAQEVLLTALPLGRNLQAGDIITVRLDRQEGSSVIDIARYYVNGEKQYETTTIPTEDVYAGIGVFNTVETTTAFSVAIDYFGCKFVP